MRIAHILRTLLLLLFVAALDVRAHDWNGGTPPRCSLPSVPLQDLQSSFRCNMDLRNARRSPVILVPGTGLTTDANFGWNYEPALQAKGWPVCTVELSKFALDDIQVSALYIAFAIRKAFILSRHKVQIIGFSQGGMAPRWALRFAPDTRFMVDDMVSLSGSNHGTEGALAGCTDFASPDPDGVVGCEPAIWQQAPNSKFLGALNKDFETVRPVDYSSIYTVFDDVLIENGGPAPTSALRGGGANVANLTLQGLCPLNQAGHFQIGTFDPVGYAMVLDALEHDGPANLTRLLGGGAPGSSPICAQDLMPGVDPNAFWDGVDAYFTTVDTTFTNGKHVTEEPPLSCIAAITTR